MMIRQDRCIGPGSSERLIGAAAGNRPSRWNGTREVDSLRSLRAFDPREKVACHEQARLARASNGAGAGNRTRMEQAPGDFKYFQKGRRINVYLIRRPVPFTRVPRSALQSEGYGHPGGHLSSRLEPFCGPHHSPVVNSSGPRRRWPSKTVSTSTAFGVTAKSDKRPVGHLRKYTPPLPASDN